uniref:Putative secreted protein n=1 Tax=Anopheles triannulatus TaxID=58253 RepID=A0A2M4B0S9_9DIPT
MRLRSLCCGFCPFSAVVPGDPLAWTRGTAKPTPNRTFHFVIYVRTRAELSTLKRCALGVGNLKQKQLTIVTNMK